MAWLSSLPCDTERQAPCQTEKGLLFRDKKKFVHSAPIDAERRRWPCQGRGEDWGGSSFSENSFINDFFCLRRDLHIESHPAGFSGFPGHRRAPHQKLQKLRDNQMIHFESLLRLSNSLQPASHLRAPIIEVVGSVPVRSWLRDLNHQLTSKSTFASKTDEAV